MGSRVKDINVENRIGESSKFRIYYGKKDDGKQVILKIAKTFEDNDTLAKEASKFSILHNFETQISSMQEKGGFKNSHYDWLFAHLTASFMEPTQGDRRINIFTVMDANLTNLVPLTKLHTKTEIDTRTSVWILGRIFKFYGLFELLAASEDNTAINYPIFSPDDYIIDIEKHRLVYYNFSDEISDITASSFIKDVAKFILSWTISKEDSTENQKYLDLIEDFAKNGRSSFDEAHKSLYSLVDDIWGIHYHPFTYRDRDTVIWKTIDKKES